MLIDELAVIEFLFAADAHGVNADRDTELEFIVGRYVFLAYVAVHHCVISIAVIFSRPSSHPRYEPESPAEDSTRAQAVLEAEAEREAERACAKGERDVIGQAGSAEGAVCLSQGYIGHDYFDQIN